MKKKKKRKRIGGKFIIIFFFVTAGVMRSRDKRASLGTRYRVPDQVHLRKLVRKVRLWLIFACAHKIPPGSDPIPSASPNIHVALSTGRVFQYVKSFLNIRKLQFLGLQRKQSISKYSRI